MFQPVATLLTLVATLLHSVLGCCWHHNHECCDAVATHTTVTDEGTYEHRGVCERHRHEHDEDAGPASGRPARPDHEHEPCGDSRCVCLTTKSVELSASASLEFSMALPPTPVAGVTEGDVALSGIDEARHSSTVHRQQQRALFQNWLI
jgi:hypothetical protein